MYTYKLKERAEEYKDYVFSIRERLHSYPELSNQEFETSKYLKEEVEKLGLCIDEVKGTGFIAILDTGKEGKTVAIRTDIDALPIEEDSCNLKHNKKYVSKNKGVMHACGHDAHMSILMGTIRILNDLKNNLNGKILFLFEEAEENGTGIYPMLEVLEKYKPDAVYGNHVLSYLKSGIFGVAQGATMAGISSIDFEVIGRGGHGSRPDLAINPVNAIAQIMSNMGTAWTNQVDVTKTVTLGITKIEVGKAGNVIADSGSVCGTLRYFDEEEGLKAYETFKFVAQKIAEAHRCEVKFNSSIEFVLPPVVNDKKLATLTQNIVVDNFGEKALEKDSSWFASESFSLYSKNYPSVFVFIGIADEDFGSGSDQHTSKFDFKNDIMLDSMVVASDFAIRFLNS